MGLNCINSFRKLFIICLLLHFWMYFTPMKLGNFQFSTVPWFSSPHPKSWIFFLSNTPLTLLSAEQLITHRSQFRCHFLETFMNFQKLHWGSCVSIKPWITTTVVLSLGIYSIYNCFSLSLLSTTECLSIVVVQ